MGRATFLGLKQSLRTTNAKLTPPLFANTLRVAWEMEVSPAGWRSSFKALSQTP